MNLFWLEGLLPMHIFYSNASIFVDLDTIDILCLVYSISAQKKNWCPYAYA